MLHAVTRPTDAGRGAGRAGLLAALTFPLSALVWALRSSAKVGGQAIIEGVMMRSKTKYSWAVRQPDGNVVVEHFVCPPITERYKVLGWPVLRGAVSFVEQLILGLKALNRSAELAFPEEVKVRAPGSKASFKDSLTTTGTLLLAFALAIGLFMYLPMQLLTWAGFEKSALAFNLLAGAIRVGLFLGYLLLISLWKDVRRLFEYHGAEHKAIFTHEDGKELTLENMRPYLTFHPRCGTSFIFLVTMICIVLFSVFDALMMKYVFASYPLLLRMVLHLALVPLMSGISYEALKLSDKYRAVPGVGWIIAPGLWLQRITTKSPSDDQLLVASQALKAAL